MWLSPVEQPRGRIEPDPAGARQVDLAPGVEIGEIVVGAGRPVERDEIGLQLDQVAGDEARGETEMAQRLHQQPARIAARALGPGQRFLGLEHAGFEPDDIADLLLHAGVERGDEVDRVHAACGRRRQGTAVSSGPAGCGFI